MPKSIILRNLFLPWSRWNKKILIARTISGGSLVLVFLTALTPVAEAFTPNDPRFSSQWGMVKIQAPESWDIGKSNPTVKIAILDYGIDQDHPDLASKIVANKNFTGSLTVDDMNGHGTFVAGIAGAITNNGIGVAGVGYDASLMNVKTINEAFGGTTTSFANGIIWAADNGANVINISWVSASGSAVLESAVNYAWNRGVVIVASAGNNGTTTPLFPSYFINAIAVAATDSLDNRASFSTYGTWVDVAAPGVGIYSTYKGGGYTGGGDGTSFAAPHVTGLAALLFPFVSDQNGDGKKNDEVRSLIENNTDPVAFSIKYGRINAFRAVSQAAGGGPIIPLATHPLNDVNLSGSSTTFSDYNAGYRFTPSKNGTVKELGGRWMSTPYTRVVRLYDMSGTVLASAAVNSSGGSFSYTSIGAGVPVSAGTSYVVAVRSTTGAYLYNTLAMPADSGGITINDSRRISASDAIPNVVSSSVVYGLADVGFVAEMSSDTTPPPVPTLLLPTNGSFTSDATPTFDWSDVSDPSGVTYTIQADNSGATFPSPEINQAGLASSTFTPASNLGDGTYSWRVRAVDGAGNQSTSAISVFGIDWTPPNTPVFDSPAAGSWQGPPSFSITASNNKDNVGGSGIGTCYYDVSSAGAWTASGISRDCGVSDGIGTFSVTTGSGAPNYCRDDGTDKCYVQLYASDLVGNWSAYSGQSFSIDLRAPSAPTGLVSVSHSLSVWSADPTVDVSWGASSDPSPGSGLAGYSVVWDTSPSTIPDNIIETTLTSRTSPSLTTGSSHYFHIVGVDNVKNISSAAHFGPFYIDVTAPPNPSAASVIASPAQNTWSNDNTVQVSWTAPVDTESGLDGYSYVWDAVSTTIPDTTKDIEETESSLTSSALSDGSSHYLHIRSRDNVGLWNVDALHIGPFKIDTVPPPVPATVSVAVPHTPAVWSSDDTISVSWTAPVDDRSGVAGYSIVWDNVSDTVPDASIETAGTSATSPALLTRNDHYFHARTVDAAGNGSPLADTIHRGPFFIDVTPPSDPATLSSSHTPGAPNADNTVDVSWSVATDQGSGPDGYSYIFDTSPFTIPDTAKDIEENVTSLTSFTTPATPALTPDGNYYFHLRTRDNVGFWTSTLHLGPFSIDTSGPIIGPISPTEATQGLPVTFSADVSDPSGIASCDLFIDGVNEGFMIGPPCSSCTVSKSYTFTSSGDHAAYAKCKDTMNNEIAGPATTILVHADNVSGWAWSEHIGWISFNRNDCDLNKDGFADSQPPAPVGCPAPGTSIPDYRVSVDGDPIDPAIGKMQGYAWSQYAGWVKFNPSTIPPGEVVAKPAIINLVSGNVSGWARACVAVANKTTCEGAADVAAGWDGWIKMRCEGPECGMSNYGVFWDAAAAKVLKNFAWADKVIGWLSFHCSDIGACASSPYAVIAAINRIPEVAGIPTAANSKLEISATGICREQTTLSWGYSDLDGDAYDGFHIQIFYGAVKIRDIFGGAVLSSVFTHGVSDDLDPESNVLNFDKTYTWKVRVKDAGGVWSSFKSGPSFTTISHAYPAANFTFSPEKPSAKEPITFTDASTPDDGLIIASRAWNFDPDGNPRTSTASSQLVTFLSTGEKTVKLAVTDNHAIEPLSCGIDSSQFPVGLKIKIKFPLPKFQEVIPF